MRDWCGSGVKFKSALVPPYVRKSPRVSAALPWLYLKGISTGDMGDALSVLLGEDAKGLSANVVSRLKAQWADEQTAWSRRDLSAARYVYWWVDGIHTGVRSEPSDGQCLLVIIGVTPEGRKERVAIGDGYRESSASWKEVLQDLKSRGLQSGPLLATGDGAMGFWAALEEVFPTTIAQRCWFHKMGNVMNALPPSQQARAKPICKRSGWAATRDDAYRAFDRLITTREARYPKAVEKLKKDRDSLLALRLSGRALAAHSHNQRHRIDVCHRASSHQPHTQLRLTRHVSGTGIQVDRGSRKKLAPDSRCRQDCPSAERHAVQGWQGSKRRSIRPAKTRRLTDLP